jgi:hypothetical protein
MNQGMTIRASANKISVAIILPVVVAMVEFEYLWKFIVATKRTLSHLASGSPFCTDLIGANERSEIVSVLASLRAEIVLLTLLYKAILTTECVLAKRANELCESSLTYAYAFSGTIVTSPTFHLRSSSVEALLADKTFLPLPSERLLSELPSSPFVDLSARLRAEQRPLTLLGFRDSSHYKAPSINRAYSGLHERILTEIEGCSDTIHKRRTRRRGGR